MANSTTVDVPHKLGREEAKRRLEAGIGGIFEHLPGGSAHVAASWPSDYRMMLDVKAMGQTASAVVDVEEQVVHIALTLPPMLGFMAGKIADGIRRSGERLLLPKGTG